MKTKEKIHTQKKGRHKCYWEKDIPVERAVKFIKFHLCGAQKLIIAGENINKINSPTAWIWDTCNV